MQRLIWAVVVSFLIALALGPVIIPWLKRMKFGQTINELGPKAHQVKQGVPTMGGVIFAIPMIVVPLLFSFEEARWDFLPVALISTLGFGLIGFVDDFIKIKMKRSLGLTAMQKIVPQVILSLALTIWAYWNPQIGSKLVVPFVQAEWDLGWFYIPVMTFIMVGVVNSANLLDGLDGLLGSCATVDFVTMALICMLLGAAGIQQGNMRNLMIFSGAAAGALLGFLRYNSYPATVFMGDVGSFFIGGALMGVCLLTRLSLLLPIVALAMMMSSISDIIQIGYYKLTHGKRVFRMAPLHHHFELGGMPETKIVSMYMIVTIVLCVISLAAFTA